jgi:hypothetical protein
MATLNSINSIVCIEFLHTYRFPCKNSMYLTPDNKEPPNFEGYAHNMVSILFEAAPSVSQFHLVLLKGISSLFIWISHLSNYVSHARQGNGYDWRY